MLSIGAVVDKRYRILRKIGRGGTSSVYLAENIRLHNLWAIKEVYKNGVSEAGEKSGMLIAESSILTKLRHPGLPSIIDIINTPQSYLLIMEYVDGVSLDKVLEQKGKCSQNDVIKWGVQLCDVLTYLHSQNPAIIYRDMKPANIMLKPDGNVVLIDFGMAREFKLQSRHDTTHLGTHGYAAPEQYSTERQSDARTDIYSLGVTMYHLVTGHDPCLPPYGVRSICEDNPSLSRSFDVIIHKCAELKPENRFQTAEELKRALSSVGKEGAFEVPFSSASDNGKHSDKKDNKWMLGCLAVPVLLALIVVVIIIGVKSSTDRFFDFIGNMEDRVFENEDLPLPMPTLNFEQKVVINNSGDREYYSFVPEKSGVYDIYSSSDNQIPVVWLYDENEELIAKDNTSGEYEEFILTKWLEEGETYYIETALYNYSEDYSATGSFWVYIDYSEENK